MVVVVGWVVRRIMKFKKMVNILSFSFVFILQDLKKHKVECHSTSFECPDCKTSFNIKSNYVRHLLECRKVAKVYDCKECNYTSFRKLNVELHEIQQHKSDNFVCDENVKEKEPPVTLVSSLKNYETIVFASGPLLKLFSIDNECVSSLKSIGTINSSFEINHLESEGDHILISGDKNCKLCFFSNENESLFESMESIEFDTEENILKSMFVKDQVLILHQKCLKIYNLKEECVDLRFECEVRDMTIYNASGNVFIFFLEENGNISYSDIHSILSNSRNIHHLKNVSASSIFYSQTIKSPLV